MIQIRPVSDLRNNFSYIEQLVKEGKPVFLTKNGYGSMVVMSLEHYERLTDQIERALHEADCHAGSSTERMTHEEVFSDIRNTLNGEKA